MTDAEESEESSGDGESLGEKPELSDASAAALERLKGGKGGGKRKGRKHGRPR